MMRNNYQYEQKYIIQEKMKNLSPKEIYKSVKYMKRGHSVRTCTKLSQKLTFVCMSGKKF